MADVAIKPEVKDEHLDDADDRLANVPGFEEDTDLQFPPEGSQSWFAKIPPELWQAWHKIYEAMPEGQAGGPASQLTVASIRVYDAPEGQEQNEQKMEIQLNGQISETRPLPQKYSLKVQTGYNNTVVFSEKDLPGHSTPAFGRNRYLTNKPAGINKSERYSKKTGYQSAIPKQTMLAPRIVHEASITAEVNAQDFFQSLSAAHKPSETVKFDFSEAAQRMRTAPRGAFSNFTTTSKPKGKKEPKNKNVRMPQSQLYSLLYKCFERYRYWRLGALRKELEQPEQYIKASLEVIANLVRTGDFAGCWMLKPEYAQIQSIDTSRAKEESAQVDSGGEDGTDAGTGDELFDDDLEDVKMEGS